MKGQFTTFLLAGGLAAAANIGSRAVLSRWIPFPAAVTLAYGVGMSVAFVLMRRYVFMAEAEPLGRQMVAFLLVNALALAQTFFVSLVLAYWLLPAFGVREHAEFLAHLAGVAVPVFTSFFAHRHGTFRKHSPTR